MASASWATLPTDGRYAPLRLAFPVAGQAGYRRFTARLTRSPGDPEPRDDERPFYTRVSDDPVALLELVIENLPPNLVGLRQYKGYTLSTMYMQRVFAARAAHEKPRLKDWLLGVFSYPRWLLNRGVWSILVRDLVMGSLTAG